MISFILYSILYLSAAFASYRPLAAEAQEQHSQNVLVRKAPEVIKDPESYDNPDNLETFPWGLPGPVIPQKYPNHYETKVLTRRQASDKVEEARPIPIKNNKPSFNYVKIDKTDSHKTQAKKLNKKVEAIKAFKQNQANKKLGRRRPSDDLRKLDKAEEVKPIPMKNNKPSFNYVNIDKTDNHRSQVKKLNEKVKAIKTYKEEAKSNDPLFKHRTSGPPPNQFDSNPIPIDERSEVDNHKLNRFKGNAGKFKNIRSLKMDKDGEDSKQKAKLNLKELGNGGVDKNPTDGAYI